MADEITEQREAEVIAGLERILTASRSVDARAFAPKPLSTVLVADRDGIHRGLADLGDFDVKRLKGVLKPRAAPVTDVTAPGVISDLHISLNGQVAVLDSSPAPDNVAVLGYVDERQVDSGSWTALDPIPGTRREDSATTGFAGSTVTYRRRALDHAGNYSANYSNVVSAIIPVLAPADTAPPSRPMSVTVTPGAGKVTVSHQASTDPYVAAAGEMAEYRYFRDGVLVATLATAAGSSPQFLLQNIGGASPAPTAVQANDGSWALTSTGKFDALAADLGGFLATQRTGDFRLTVQVDAVANVSGSSVPSLLVQARESLAPGSKHISIFLLGSYAAGGVGMRSRSATDAVAVNGTIIAGVFAPALLDIQRVGDVFTLSYGQNLNALTTLWSGSYSLASTLYWGIPLGEYFGSAATASISNVNATSESAVSQDIPATLSGSYQVSALDSTGNESVRSVAVVGSPITNAIKWHPGHYMALDKHRFSPAQQAADFAEIDAYATNPSIKGVYIWRYWDELEGDTAGDYSSGFANVDAYVAKCASKGLRFMLVLNERQFAAPWPAGHPVSSDMQGFAPAYLLSSSFGAVNAGTAEFGGVVASPSGVVWAGSLRAIARSWTATIADRLIALSAAYANRYDANPHFEMFAIDAETSVGGPPPSFSYAAYIAQLKRIYGAARAQWLKTQVRAYPNYLDTDARMQDFMDWCAANGVTMGGPDTADARNVQSDRMWVGEVGSTDYRGLVPWVAEYQNPVASYYGTPTAEYTFAKTVLRMAYMLWNVHNGSTSPKGPSDIMACISANPTMGQPTAPAGWVVDTG